MAINAWAHVAAAAAAPAVEISLARSRVSLPDEIEKKKKKKRKKAGTKGEARASQNTLQTLLLGGPTKVDI